MSLTLEATTAAPAGGAAASEILIAAGIAAVYFGITGWVLLRERTGHPTLIGRGAGWLGDKVGLPVWAVIPTFGLLPVWLLAGFGVYWDVPIHMQKGRDAGPLANPSHYPIFLVLLFLACMGVGIMALARSPLPKHTLKLAPGWKVPFSAVLLTIAGFIAVCGFPADDAWHRMFGQDVTEWGPTHVMMIGGAITSPFCMPLLFAEARQVGARFLAGTKGRWLFGYAFSICMLPFAFLMEFDLGLPQFPASTEFIIFGFLMTWVCVATRIWFGGGGALYTLFWWWFAHVFLVLIILPLPGILTIRFMSAIPVAVIVELVALAFGVRRGGARLVPFAVVSGLLAGSLGLWLEWLWAEKFMTIKINGDALPFLLTVGTIAAVGGGLFALWHVRRTLDVAGDDQMEAAGFTIAPTFRRYGLAGFGIFVVLMAIFSQPKAGEPVPVTVSFDHVTAGQEECPGTAERCEAYVTVTFPEEDHAKDAVWFTGYAWQGWRKGIAAADVPKDPIEGVPGVVRTRMLPTGEPGQYRSADPMPMYGGWKSMIRIHEAPRTMMTWVLYMPDDPALKSARGRMIHVTDGQTVESAFEPKMLQRERKDSIPDWVYGVANDVVLSGWLLVLLLFGWCYNRAAGQRREGTRTA
ncbi:hypothetical protein [Nocardioides jiangxiensis]|uniref:ABC transporter permease n=1 Tax=Nocardioides jiangxiensis TaxID=3064524 RepID=A0ABT9B1S1_9ACTN|nr:hypothetical protein [Nocardioides sp. WY-20]MDO7867226.1 hypothetical protein [Nocardioides sp. WY-20]